LPNIKIGSGAFGPISLLIYKKKLFALKRIPKSVIDKPKRIQNLNNEKGILLMLRNIQEEILNGNFARLDLVETANRALNIDNSQMDTSGMFGTASFLGAAR